MSYGWHDLIGNVGVLLILASYLLLQLGKIRAPGLRYSVVNGIGSFLILVTLWVEFNLSAFLIEAAWLLISLFGIVQYLRQTRALR